MTTTSDVPVTPGTGANVASYDITEDAKTKKVQRVVLNKSDGTEATFAPPGQQATSAATTVVPPSDWKSSQCGAGATTSLGASGAANDWLDGIYIIPLTTSPGAVTYQDGTGATFTVFAGGTVGDVKGFYVPIGAAAATRWKVTCGADVQALAYGKFT